MGNSSPWMSPSGLADIDARNPETNAFTDVYPAQVLQDAKA